MFALLGYEGVSMGNIAKACHRNKATIYHYFPSKELLYNDIVTSYLNGIVLDIGKNTLPLPDAKEQIKAFINTLLIQPITMIKIVNRIHLGEIEHLNDENRKTFNNLQKSFDAVFKTGIVNGEFKMMSPETVYHVIWGAATHYCLEKSLLERKEDEDRRFSDELFEMVHALIKS